MKNTKKILALVLAFVLAISATAAITMALLTDEDETVNIMTIGNVYIDQVEQERDASGALKEFTPGQLLLPAFYTTNGLEMDAAANWPVANDAAWSTVVANENVIDKFVTVTNIGTTEAYVRTVFAVEVGTCRDKIHLNVNDTTDWAWEVAAQGVEIAGSTYDILVATYAKPLAPGATTIPSLKQVYLDVTATNEDVNSFNGQYEILVKSQAVQATGFGALAYSVNTTAVEVPAMIEGALNVAFKEVTATTHPWVDGVVIDSYVLSAENLQAALSKGGNVILTADIVVPEGKQLVIPEGTKVNLDLNGKTITGDIHKNDGHVIKNAGELTISNGTVVSAADNGGSAIYNATGATLTVENTVITGAPKVGSSWPSYAVNNYGVMTISDSTVTSIHGGIASSGANAVATLNNVDATIAPNGEATKISSHVLYTSNNGTMIVNGGNYTNNASDASSTGGTIVCNYTSSATITINGGTFKGGVGLAEYSKGNIYVTGGTFDRNVKNYLASKYHEVVNNGDGTYTVQVVPGTVLISNADELKAAFNQGASTFAARAIANTYVLTADIDMGGFNWTPVEKFTGTFKGDGHTISNLNISGNSRVAFFGQISGASIMDVTFDNVKVSGNHYVGVLFGWEGAESIQSYVTNVKVTNSTVTCTAEFVEAEKKWDNGDKVGGIGGYAVTTTITGCAVENTKISAYRDAGGILGYAHKGAEVTGCTSSNLTMTWDNSNNYNKFTTIGAANLGAIVGGANKDAKVEKGESKITLPVSSADDLASVLESQESVVFTDDIKIEPAGMSNAYGTTGINVKNGQTVDGNNHVLDIKGAGGTWDSGINTTGGTIKNITVTGSFRGIFINHNSTHSERVILENVTIQGTVYTISCDQGSNKGLTATNSTFKGWTSYAATLGDAKFVDCYFGEGSGYAYCRPYAPTEFVGCDFEAGFQMDARAAVTFKDCTIGGVALTAENLATLVTSNIANASVVE